MGTIKVAALEDAKDLARLTAELTQIYVNLVNGNTGNFLVTQANENLRAVQSILAKALKAVADGQG